MPRRPTVDPISDAARGALVEGERVVEYGHCWGAQHGPRLPLMLARRHQYLMVLTDRRLLLFTRRPGPVQAKDLVIGKRYETFQLEKVHRARPLLQVRINASSGTRMVFEFRPSRRNVGDALVHRLAPRAPIAALPAPVTPDAEAPTAPHVPTAAPASEHEAADPTFWGTPARRT